MDIPRLRRKFKGGGNAGWCVEDLSVCKEGLLRDPVCHSQAFLGDLGAWTPIVSSAVVLVGLWLFWSLGADFVALRSASAREKRFGWLAGDGRENHRQTLLGGLAKFGQFVGDHDKRAPQFLHLSAQSYLFVLGLAAAYPFLFMVISWALFDGSGSFGGLQLLPSSATQTDRIVVLAAANASLVWGLAFVTGCRLLRFLAERAVGAPSRWRQLIAKSAQYASFGVFLVFLFGACVVAQSVVGAVAGPVAGLLAYNVAGSVYFISVFAGLFAVAGPYNLGFVGAGAAGGGLAVAAAFAGAFSRSLHGDGGPVVFFPFLFIILMSIGYAFYFDRGRHRRGLIFGVVFALTALVSALLLALLDFGLPTSTITSPAMPTIPVWQIPESFPETVRTYFADALARRIAWQAETPILFAPFAVFLALLPAINAPIDWLSLGVSRSLIRWTASAKANWQRSRWFEFLVIQFDLVLALAFGAVIALMTAAGLALFDRLRILGGGEGVFPTIEYIARLRADPHAEEFWWLYLMMGWTLVPTLVHAVTFVYSFVALVPARLGWVGQMSAAPPLQLPFVMFAVRVSSIVIAGFALWEPVRMVLVGADFLFGFEARDYFIWLADTAEDIARFISDG